MNNGVSSLTYHFIMISVSSFWKAWLSTWNLSTDIKPCDCFNYIVSKILIHDHSCSYDFVWSRFSCVAISLTTSVKYWFTIIAADMRSFADLRSLSKWRSDAVFTHKSTAFPVMRSARSKYDESMASFCAVRLRLFAKLAFMFLSMFFTNCNFWNLDVHS